MTQQISDYFATRPSATVAAGDGSKTMILQGDALKTVDSQALVSATAGNPVVGWSNEDGTPTTATQAKIDALIAAGIPEDEIAWIDLGQRTANSVFVIVDAVAPTSIETVTLTLASSSGGTFVIADAVAVPFLDQLTILGEDFFIIQDAESESTIDGIALFQHGGTFAVADAESPTVIDTPTLGAGNSAPTAPTALSANAFLSDGTGFDIHYVGATDSDGTVASYNIYRNGAFLVNTGTAVTTYSITGRTAGETADYQVSAVDNLGLEGALSSAASVTITPATPTITVTPGDTTNVIAKTSGGTGATSYNIKWGTVAGTRSNTITGVTLPYTHTGRDNGTAYYYSLVAINAGGSVESAEVSGTPVGALIPSNPGFESAIGTVEGPNWWPWVQDLTGLTGAIAISERLATGAMTGSYVGHIKSKGSNADDSVWDAMSFRSLIADFAAGSRLTFDLQPHSTVTSEAWLALAVHVFDSGGVEIENSTNGKNYLNIWNTSVSFPSASSAVKYTPALNTTATVTFDLKDFITGAGAFAGHGTILNSGKTWSNVSKVVVDILAVGQTGADTCDVYIDNFR